MDVTTKEEAETADDANDVDVCCMEESKLFAADTDDDAFKTEGIDADSEEEEEEAKNLFSLGSDLSLESVL